MNNHSKENGSNSGDDRSQQMEQRTQTGPTNAPDGKTDDDELKVILLATQPRMMREMLHRALTMASNMRLVLETDEPDRISALLNRIQADWLVTTLTREDGLPGPVESAIERHPSVSVIGLSQDGSHAIVTGKGSENGAWERRKYSLDNVSLAELLEILEDSDEGA